MIGDCFEYETGVNHMLSPPQPPDLKPFTDILESVSHFIIKTPNDGISFVRILLVQFKSFAESLPRSTEAIL